MAQSGEIGASPNNFVDDWVTCPRCKAHFKVKNSHKKRIRIKKEEDQHEGIVRAGFVLQCPSILRKDGEKAVCNCDIPLGEKS